MATAALKSILESAVDQLIKMNNTQNKPSHKKGEGITDPRNPMPSAREWISIRPAEATLFLKQNWPMVSITSIKARNKMIFKVICFLLDMVPCRTDLNRMFAYIIRQCVILSRIYSKGAQDLPVTNCALRSPSFHSPCAVESQTMPPPIPISPWPSEIKSVRIGILKKRSLLGAI